MCRIFGTDEARNFKFGTWIDLGKSHHMDDKMCPKGRGQGPGAKFLNFKPPSVNLEGTGEARNFKFGVPIDLG